MRNGVPAWITEAWQAEDVRRALALTPLGKVFGQLEHGLITVQEFADQVNRIVGAPTEGPRGGGMMSFQAWMRAVDSAVQAEVGLSVHDLADANFRDWYEDGVSPSEAAVDVLADNGWER